MSLEENLKLLNAVVKKSRSKKLKKAFTIYINSLNNSLRNYIFFLELMKGFKPNVKVETKWDVTFERRRD